MNLDDYVLCATCRKATNKFSLFPGNICLTCYELTPEANAPLTVQGLQQLTRTWSGR